MVICSWREVGEGKGCALPVWGTRVLRPLSKPAGCGGMGDNRLEYVGDNGKNRLGCMGNNRLEYMGDIGNNRLEYMGKNRLE